MAFVTDVREVQALALLDAYSSTQELELLIESDLIPEEWFPMTNASLLELTAQEITTYVFYLALQIGYKNKTHVHTESGAENSFFNFE